MSGAEAIAVLGLISSVISIVDAIKQVHDAASSSTGLPVAFKDAATRLHIIRIILQSVESYIQETETDEEWRERAKCIVENCRVRAQKMKELFDKVIPADSAAKMERYLKAVRTLGKGSRVETLMKGTLEDLQLLAMSKSMIVESDDQKKELSRAIEEVTALPPSLPEQATNGSDVLAFHYGSGQIIQGGHFQAETMSFGSHGKN